MPKIPIYESKEQFDTSPSNVRVSPEAMGQATSESIKLGGIMADQGNQLIKIAGQQEYNTVSSATLDQMNKVKAEAAADKDFTKAEEYQKKLKKIVDDGSKQFKVPFARSEYESKMTNQLIASNYELQKDFMAKRIDAGGADFLGGVELRKQTVRNAVDPVQRLQAMTDLKSYIEMNAGTYVTRENAAKMWINLQKEIPVQEASDDIAENPQIALRRLQDNVYGIQEADKVADLMKEAENAILRQQRMAEKGIAIKHEKTAADLTVKLLQGQLTQDDIINNLKIGDLTDTDAMSLKRAMTSAKTAELKPPPKNSAEAKVIEVQQASTYMAMWDMILKQGKAADKRNMLLKEYSDGRLSRTDFNKLYTGYIIPAQGGGKVSLAEEVAAETVAKKAGFWASAINMFKRFRGQPEIQLESEEESE